MISDAIIKFLWKLVYYMNLMNEQTIIKTVRRVGLQVFMNLIIELSSDIREDSVGQAKLSKLIFREYNDWHTYNMCKLFMPYLIQSNIKTGGNPMSGAVKTRHGMRTNRFSTRRKVDASQRKAVTQQKLMYLEDDFYEDPDKMAQFDDHDVFEEDGKTRKLKNEKRIIKRVKKECQLKRNLNLRKVIQEEGLQQKKQPNFVNIKVGKPRYPSRKYCSICGNLSRSSCPRCGQRICALKCFRIHTEIRCLNFQIHY